jgi:hypothetical protein
MMLYLDCPTCGAPREAEVPPCPDGHQGECPDRACVECGTALVVDPLMAAEHAARYAAPSTRRARPRAA